ncbi:MAG: acylneuraminate cytidylyltransferase family protein [Treponema sp.]|jgi:CMP-N-acetylneuraminic acid synthetase|nr:acylneuraminate cytidylyltransferase family protein [Treponema sp.]
MKIKALIAVRSGSVRVSNKNIKSFAGSTLLELKIKQLKTVKELEGIIVNSNDDSMLKIAVDLGIDAVKRSDYYASNSVSMSDVYKNMAENFDADVVMYSNVTNPLVKTESYSNAINKYKELQQEIDSLNSAHLIKEFMFLDGKPINYDLQKQPRSQDLPDIFALNFAFSIIKKEDMIKYKNVIGYKPFLYELSEIESIDIDTQFDFDIAEYMYNKTDSH